MSQHLGSVRPHRKGRGFSLVELLVVSVIGSLLVAGTIQFFLSQLRMTQALHQTNRAHVQTEHVFSRVSQSVRRVQLPIGTGRISVSSQTLVLEYWAGGATQNCHGTGVAPGSLVKEWISLEGTSLRCRASYTAENGASKTDHQPMAFDIANFRVHVTQTGSCVHAVDLFLRDTVLENGFERSHRIVFPACTATDGAAT